MQIAAEAGLEVIAITSQKTTSLVRDLGAHHGITRDGKTNAQIVDEIRSICEDRITRGVDLVGNKTAQFCIQALSTTNPVLFAPWP